MMLKCVKGIILFKLCLIIHFTYAQDVNEQTYVSPLHIPYSSWTEHSKNIEFRQNGSTGFIYNYKFPDASDSAFAFFRTYDADQNSAYTIIELKKNLRKIKYFTGRFKFSGTDIDQTNDTLIVSCSLYNKLNDTVIDRLEAGDTDFSEHKITITEPISHFRSFKLELPELPNKKNEKLFLVLLVKIKSGSDDNYYFGESHAVIDNLSLITY